jgi:hypothetical protein
MFASIDYTKEELKAPISYQERSLDEHGVTRSLRTVMNVSRIKIEKDWRGVKQMLKIP